MVTRNQRGVLHIPLGLTFFVILLLGIGAWGILRQWRGLAEVQLRIDECVGKKAIEFRALLNDLETSNVAIRATRAAITAATEVPQLRASLTEALVAQVEAQDVLMMNWSATELGWMAQRGCGGAGDIPFPLPGIPAERDPPDDIGPQALRWTDSDSEESKLRIELRHSPRSAAAQVERDQPSLIGGLIGSSEWKASWARPRAALGVGTSFP